MPPKRGRHVTQDTVQTTGETTVSETATLVSATAATLSDAAATLLVAPPAFAIPKGLQARLAAHRAPQASTAPLTEQQSVPAPHGGLKRPRETVPADTEHEMHASVHPTNPTADEHTAQARPVKPKILSRRWRAQVLTTATSTTAPTTAEQEASASSPHSTTGVRRRETVAAVTELFTNSADDVIKFGRVPDGASRELVPSSSDDGNDAWSDDSTDAGDEATAAGASETRAETAQERQRRKRREARHRQLFDKHVEEYEESALQAHEAALLDRTESSGSDDEGNEDEEESVNGSDEGTTHNDVHAILRQHAHGTSGPQRFGSMFFANHIDEASLAASLTAASNVTHHGGADDDAGAFPCYHTLLGVNEPVTIQGPCGVVGLGMGEVSVGGFYLGKKQLALWNPLQQAVVTPVARLKAKGAERETLPQWGHGRAYKLSTTTRASRPHGEPAAAANGDDDDSRFECLTPVDVQRWRKEASTVETARAAEPLHDDDDDAIIDMDLSEVEPLFGTIDWRWVEEALAKWKAYFATRRMPLAVLLVVRPYEPGRTFVRRHYLRRRDSGTSSSSSPPPETFLEKARATEQRRYRAHNNDDAFVEIPSFIAKFGAQQIDLALLPDVIPAAVQRGSGAVVVVGSANIGKSTLCRFLANAFLSQHGLCYWLDMDLGQPEFGVPGQLSLYCVRHPLFRNGDELHCAELVQALFLGSATVRCPVAMGNAIAAMAALVCQVQREHPVVVNTHGWVLQTGRRTTTELIQRIRPRHVIHLLKPKETAWARDANALMDPVNGLNAEVLSSRFLVRLFAPSPSSSGAKQARRSAKQRVRHHVEEAEPASGVCVNRLGRLPHPPVVNSRNTKPSAQSRGAWDGEVHTVFVERTTSAAQRHALANEKGGRGRKARWQQYFAPLLVTCEAEHQQREKSQQEIDDHGASGNATCLRRPFGATGVPRQAPQPLTPTHSTRIRAPLSMLRAIVIAELDERTGSLPLRHVAALLEHGVVAVQFHCPTTATATTSKAAVATPLLAVDEDGNALVRVQSLTSLEDGFPVTCYALVESTEEEWCDCAAVTAAGGDDSEKQGPMLTLHVPLPPDTVRALLTRCEQTRGGLSIAYSPALRDDTAFLESVAQQ